MGIELRTSTEGVDGSPPTSVMIPVDASIDDAVPVLSLAGKRVLLVEDNYLVAFDLQYELLDRGAEIIGPIDTLSAALDLTRSPIHIDAAVVDIDLCGESAVPLMDELVSRGIAFVISSGCDMDLVPDRFRHIPFHSKPSSPGELAESIAKLIGAA